MNRKTIGRDLPRPAPRRPADRAAGAAKREAAAFWRFSLAFYARPGVAGALIALQDRAGLDVNLILFGLWVGVRHGRALGPEEFAAAAERAAEPNEIGDRDARRLRGVVLRLELAAERQVQRRLAAHMAPAPAAAAPVPGEPCCAALANLARCLGDESRSAEAAILRRELAATTQRA